MIKKHTFSLLTFSRNDKINSDGQAPVYLRITVDGVRALLSTQKLVELARWNPAKVRIKGNTEETRLLNETIENFEHRAREIYNRFLEHRSKASIPQTEDQLEHQLKLLTGIIIHAPRKAT